MRSDRSRDLPTDGRLCYLEAGSRSWPGESTPGYSQSRRSQGWQAVAGLDDGELIVERRDAKPDPVVEVRESLADGTEIQAVWSHLRQAGVAKRVTVHFFDED